MRDAAHAAWDSPELRCHSGKIVRARWFAHVPGFAAGEGTEDDDLADGDGPTDGAGVACGVAAAPCTDDHSCAYHGSSGAAAPATVAEGLGVGLSVT